MADQAQSATDPAVEQPAREAPAAEQSAPEQPEPSRQAADNQIAGAGARAGAAAMMERDRASAALGMAVLEAEPGRAVVSMRVRDDMLNGFDIAHGGIVFSLADTAFAIACNEDDRVTVAAGADITFLASARAGALLTATAVRRARSGRSGLYDVTIADDAGVAVAEFRGRSRVTNRPLPADAHATGGADTSAARHR